MIHLNNQTGTISFKMPLRKDNGKRKVTKYNEDKTILSTSQDTALQISAWSQDLMHQYHQLVLVSSHYQVLYQHH